MRLICVFVCDVKKNKYLHCKHNIIPQKTLNMVELLQILDPISSGNTQEESEYQICRFCLENSANYINLLEKCGEEISTFLQTYHNITIDPCDAWPKSACLSCVSRITSFRTLCDTIRNSEEALRQIFGDSTSNVCVKKEEEACEEVFSESFPEALPESFPETLPQNFPETLPESLPESLMETTTKEELPVEQKLEEFEEFFSMTCDLCKKKFIRFTDMCLHFRQDHNRPWYLRCCDGNLRDKKSILIHLQYHRNPDIFKCPECSRQFRTESAKTKHINNSHMPEKRIFECDLCQKSFPEKRYLRRHIEQTHLKFPGSDRGFSRRPISECICETCGKSFLRKEQLRLHVKIHAVGPNGEPLRAYKCEKCGKTYRAYNTLTNHMKRHNVYGTYTCKECGKISPTPSALSKHILDAHKLTRDFICHICHKGFKRNTALREHVATHTGEYLYTCDYCPKQFRASASKSQHIGREHPEKRKKR